jgi:3-methyladenine DNA glycosylase/8-oxoguanine DNA glycosylase
MLHALGDPDAFPATDRRLRAAARACGLPTDPAELTRHADRWRPWRGYAAHLLWHVTNRRAVSSQVAETRSDREGDGHAGIRGRR